MLLVTDYQFVVFIVAPFVRKRSVGQHVLDVARDVIARRLQLLAIEAELGPTPGTGPDR